MYTCSSDKNVNRYRRLPISDSVINAGRGGGDGGGSLFRGRERAGFAEIIGGEGDIHTASVWLGLKIIDG